MKRVLVGLLLLSCVIPYLQASGQVDNATAVRSEHPGAGDTPANAPPLATHVSTTLQPKAVAKVMRKVGNWQLDRARTSFNQEWTFATLYRGLMSAAKSLPDVGYEDALLQAGNKFDWKLGPDPTDADDQAVGHTYIALYRDYHDSKMIAPTQERLERQMKLPDNPAKPVWWWCDALFMAPSVWADLSAVTGKPSYLDYMDHEWWITSNLLYDPHEHLYSRDASFLNVREKNGKKLFWSRGNGWVMAGIAQVLAVMPKDYPNRSKYVKQLQEMSARIASIQGADGLWRPGLLDPQTYPLPEVSGSAFFVYALAWGINHDILDRTTYLPVVRKGWKGLVSCVYADGRLGSIQPIAGAPGAYKPQSSYVYGVGAFLLAGSEVRSLREP